MRQSAHTLRGEPTDLWPTAPTAMLLLPDRLPKYPASKPVAPEARACYDRSVACQRGVSFIVGTAEGGVCSVAEIDERDWAVLREVQSRARTHPLTAPVLGASHENAHGAWPPTPTSETWRALSLRESSCRSSRRSGRAWHP